MKKYIYILAAFAAVLACSKESVTEEKAEEETPEEVHELFVSLPEMTDADTKATISTSDGTFTWKAGDAIAVITSTAHTYKFIAASNSSSGTSNAVRFTYTGTMDGTPATIFYPWKDTSPYYETSLPTSISSLTGALSADHIRLTGTVSNNSATLSYTNAFLKITFTSAPSFASSIVFDGNVNDVTVSGISLDSRGDVTAYIPVSASTTAFSVSLQDNAGNEIVSKSTSGKSFTAGTIKNMKAVTVAGTVFTFTDSSDSVDEAKFFKSDGNTTDYSKYSDLKLKVLTDGTTKWCIVNNSDLGSIVELQTFKSSGYKSETKSIFLYRDFNIVIPSGGAGIKTNYRTYFYLQTSNSQTYWGSTTNIKVHDSWYAMTKTGDYLFYYENSLDDYGQTMSYSINNGNGWVAISEQSPWAYTLNREYQYNFNG